jgi:hypothetical protein
MHSEDKFGLWLSIMDVIKRWESGDGAYKIHLYDGAPNERMIGDMVSALRDGLEPLMTTKRLPQRAAMERKILNYQEDVRRKHGKA